MKEKASSIAKREHKRVLAFIRVVRNAFPDAAIVFTHGACFGFYQILREAFPSAQPFMTEDAKHVVTKIGGRFYDIHGECVKLDGNLKENVSALTELQLEYWESVASGQRVEYMIKKYNS